MRWSLKEHLQIDQMAQAAAHLANNLKISVTEAVDAMEVDQDMYDDILRNAKKHFAELEKPNKQSEN